MNKADRLATFQDTPYSKEEERELCINCIKELIDVTDPVLVKHFGTKVLTGHMLNRIILPWYLTVVKQHFEDLPKKERDATYISVYQDAMRILQNSFTNTIFGNEKEEQKKNDSS